MKDLLGQLREIDRDNVDPFWKWYSAFECKEFAHISGKLELEHENHSLVFVMYRAWIAGQKMISKGNNLVIHF